MITLYQRTDCPFCWKVRLALAELDVEFVTVELELGQKHPDVLRYSPTGTVPVLVNGETVIWESSVILDYLDGQYAPGSLIPTEPVAQARIRLLHAYSDKLVGGCMKDLVFEKRSKPEREWDHEVIGQAGVKWKACQAWLEEKLGDGPYFGDSYSSADCALAARFGVAQAYGAAVTREFPGLHTWHEHITTRKSWKEAYPTSFIRTE